MSLKRLFWLVSIALMSLFLMLTAGQVATQWNVYRHGAESVRVVRQLQLALRVMETISVERGPTNGLLGASAAETPAALEKLAQARLNSDRSIAALLDDLNAHPHPAYANYPAIAAGMITLRTELAAARQNVDKLAGQPLAARDSDQISDAVNRMIALIGRTLLATTDLSAIAISADPVLRDGIASARLAASLREYAGQIGSVFTAAIATRRPLRSSEVIAIAKLTGRAEQMRLILDLQLRSYKSPPALRSALDDVDSLYFGEGVPLLNRLLDIGLHSGDYGMSTGELATRYVPKMKSIIVLRDEIMDETLDSARARAHRAGMLLLGAIALALAGLAVFCLLLRIIHTRIVAPVVEATRLFAALANDELDTPIPALRGVEEISNLFRAMAVFKAGSISRIALEKEREALITQLQATSDTDFLTGLMNRRAFFTQGEALFAVTQRYQSDLALILMDVDHFKRVNDDYGHQTGDMALQQVATLCRQMHRKGDIVVRYGGEEFLMLLPHTDKAQAIGVAEKLRLAIASQTVALVSGETLQLSASFGVAAYDNDNSLEALIWRADQALYNAKNNGRNQVQPAF
ncbi:GGDEF domain-containing protein [Oxalobacteraceae bacterium CAVE-383]|nr:GGDEF domain-containing protein [Oxalobacteraceae bacterium CAVE-383]